MTIMLIILGLLAIGCFVAAALNVSSNFNLTAAGLAFATIAVMVTYAG